jgi:hypothetical protein
MSIIKEALAKFESERVPVKTLDQIIANARSQIEDIEYMSTSQRFYQGPKHIYLSVKDMKVLLKVLQK